MLLTPGGFLLPIFPPSIDISFAEYFSFRKNVFLIRIKVFFKPPNKDAYPPSIHILSDPTQLFLLQFNLRSRVFSKKRIHPFCVPPPCNLFFYSEFFSLQSFSTTQLFYPAKIFLAFIFPTTKLYYPSMCVFLIRI